MESDADLPFVAAAAPPPPLPDAAPPPPLPDPDPVVATPVEAPEPTISSDITGETTNIFKGVGCADKNWILAAKILLIIDEFGSFDKYIWSFVNHKPTVSNFRYPRQVPIKTSKAEVISKDLVRRGFRGVGPTVVYSFMQVSGITNDHLISCFRFQDCIDLTSSANKNISLKAKMEDKDEESAEFGLARVISELNLSEESSSS